MQDTNGIGGLNPFRYRGYYWDSEINLYYLNARYYDPEVGRFISQDSISYLAPEVINGINLFAYCLNNPIRNIDDLGNAPQENNLEEIDIVSIIDILFSIALAYMHSVANTFGRLDVLNTVGKMASGASNLTSYLGYISLAINTISNVVTNIQNGVNPNRIITDMIVDVAIGVGSIWASAALGAMMGSWMPGIGNLIGAAAGLMVGLVLYAMDDVVEKVKDVFYTVVTTTVDFIYTKVNDALEWFFGLFV